MNDVPPQMNSSEEIFPDTELNDPIECSELTDLPLESVMELFRDDSQSEENKPLQQVENAGKVADTSMDNTHPLENKQTQENESIDVEDNKNEIKLEQQKRVAELKEFVDHEKENSILSAYIKAHREDTTEEHAEELMRMIKEELETKANKETKEITSDTITLDPQMRASDIVEEKASVSEALTDNGQNSEIADEKKINIELNKETDNNEETIEKSKIKNAKESSQQNVTENNMILPAVEKTAEANTRLIEQKNNQTEHSYTKKSFDEKGNRESEPSKEEALPDEMPRKKQTDSVMEAELEKISTEKQKVKQIGAIKTNHLLSKRSKKGTYLTLAAVLLLGLGGWSYYDHQQNVQAQIAAQKEAQKQKVLNLKQALADFYTDNSHQFINTSMINQDLTKLKAALAEAKSEKEYPELEKAYDDIQMKIKDIKHVNELFTTPVIANDHLIDAPKIKADKEIQSIATDETAFGQLIKKAQNEANNQYQQLQVAKEKMKDIYNENKVMNNVTRERYNQAKAAVDKVKNEELTTSLKEQLKQVEDSLIAKEKEEAQKKAEEDKKAEEAKKVAEATAQAQAARQATQQANSSRGTSIPSTNSANQPILSTRQSDVADTSNPAWNWAPGVQESVIATCVQRGYIIEGGYRLEKARIENGEGYYNLYATSTKSALMNGIGESALPFYIVTINCKTGWFGGNGNH
ncbi:MAG: TFIIB-type zinc ribbon-containing protein [Enterococcus lacertideformus]|uniref:TFIIB-type zinc ribbon-containing protein n=1 Tax=Enterococcus lacertideformus TaxID=2771493 RepID=A0A931B218_9ENTE|nr:TFIIB-type zinc ribbon-containing protein [Enterococcus lacertideformus]